MKQIYFSILALFCISTFFAQEVLTKKLKSLDFDAKRDVKIFLPKGYKNDTVSKYPVAIVLNDDYLFDLYVGTSKIYARADLAPKQIVVGIKTDTRTNKDVSTVKRSGALTTNGKKFYNFIKKDLIPYLKTNYETSPFFSVIGEGEAGNFLFSFLQESKPLFNTYVSISPKLTEQTGERIGTYNLSRLNKIDNKFYVYTSFNPYESKKRTDIYDRIKQGLTELNSDKINVTFDDFKGSVNKPLAIAKSIPNSFVKTFELYPKISKEEYEEKIKDLAPLEAIKYVEDKYIELNYIYGTNKNVRLNDVFAIEGIVIDRQDGDYLRVLGDFVMIKHPESHIGDYYNGMYHELGKDYDKAIFYYKEAYGRMDPSDPNKDAFYNNIDRVEKAKQNAPAEQPLDDIPLDDEDDYDDEENNDDNEDDDQQEDDGDDE